MNTHERLDLSLFLPEPEFPTQEELRLPLPPAPPFTESPSPTNQQNHTDGYVEITIENPYDTPPTPAPIEEPKPSGAYFVITEVENPGVRVFQMTPGISEINSKNLPHLAEIKRLSQELRDNPIQNIDGLTRLGIEVQKYVQMHGEDEYWVDQREKEEHDDSKQYLEDLFPSIVDYRFSKPIVEQVIAELERQRQTASEAKIPFIDAELTRLGTIFGEKT